MGRGSHYKQGGKPHHVVDESIREQIAAKARLENQKDPRIAEKVGLMELGDRKNHLSERTENMRRKQRDIL